MIATSVAGLVGFAFLAFILWSSSSSDSPALGRMRATTTPTLAPATPMQGPTEVPTLNPVDQLTEPSTLPSAPPAPIKELPLAPPPTPPATAVAEAQWHEGLPTERILTRLEGFNRSNFAFGCIFEFIEELHPEFMGADLAFRVGLPSIGWHYANQGGGAIYYLQPRKPRVVEHWNEHRLANETIVCFVPAY